MTGKLEPTNSPYAIAKIAGIEMGRALSKQYGNLVLNLILQTFMALTIIFQIKKAMLFQD